jgi:lipopolysaccharide transport system ATP-binding protein
MEREVLVRAEGVSKKFAKDLKKSLLYGLSDVATSLFGNTNKQVELRKDEFWAVQDVSFEVRRGECLGLIGHNGAGKSTLLKMLNGLIAPDKGRIEMHGRVGALIELGAGFNPILTGRENIFNNAAVLGFSKKEILEKFDEIVEFAEIGDYLDMPVQNYSSGMRVRLGFAVAAQLQPDVLIVDEVLAVGDLGFVLKCLNRIDKIIPHTSVIFVSHSMPMVSRICSEIILMDKGNVLYQGKNVAKGIDKYYNKFSSGNLSVVFDDKSIELLDFKFNNVSVSQKSFTLNWCDDLNLGVVIRNISLKKTPYLVLSIFDKEYRPIAQINANIIPTEISSGLIEFQILIPQIQLSKGLYFINVIFSEEKNSSTVLRINNIAKLQVIHEEQCWPPFLLNSQTRLTID